MKIFEVTEKPMPHLYLDMDGVQADLFHAIAKRERVDHWDDIPDQDEAITRLSLKGPEAVYELFRNLDPLPGGMAIVKWLRNNNIPFTILSAPLRNQPDASIQAKKDWLDEHNPGTSKMAKFTKQKQMYAITNGYPNVLVDDFNYYLDKWKNAGGIPVKHKEGETVKTLEMLEKIYGPYLGR